MTHTLYYCFPEASHRAGILNTRMWLTNHALVTISAFCNTDHGSEILLAVIMKTNSKCCENIHEHLRNEKYERKITNGKKKMYLHARISTVKVNFTIQRKKPSAKQLFVFGLTPYSGPRKQFFSIRTFRPVNNPFIKWI